MAAADAGIQMAQIHSDAPSFLRGVTIPVVRAVHLAIDRIDGVEPDIADDRCCSTRTIRCSTAAPGRRSIGAARR